MLTNDFIKKFKDSPEFTLFQDYVVSKMAELDSVDGLEDMTNEQAGEEVKVRNKAKIKLYEILAPFLDYSEKREPTAEEINKAKGKFGI